MQTVTIYYVSFACVFCYLQVHLRAETLSAKKSARYRTRTFLYGWFEGRESSLAGTHRPAAATEGRQLERSTSYRVTVITW